MNWRLTVNRDVEYIKMFLFDIDLIGLNNVCLLCKNAFGLLHNISGTMNIFGLSKIVLPR